MLVIRGEERLVLELPQVEGRCFGIVPVDMLDGATVTLTPPAIAEVRRLMRIGSFEEAEALAASLGAGDRETLFREIARARDTRGS